MSELNDLTRDELIALIVDLHETVEVQSAHIAELEVIVEQQSERISQLEEEISKLSGRKAKPAWVKPNVAQKEDATRKKRMQSFARKTLVATQVRYHALESCPDCGRKLSGGSVKWGRQTTDIPPVKVEVIEHLFVERRCGVCGKRFTPDVNEALGDLVVGKRTIGIRFMSLIAYLKTVCRLPVGMIKRLLESLYGVKVSVGEIVELLHAVAEIGHGEYVGLLDRVRGSPVVHGDETGWREDGKNGYLWSFSTPEVRYFAYRHTRAGTVVSEVLGDEFEGALVSDFYGGYNVYDGIKQRCWVHYLRDLKDLVEKNPDDAGVSSWVAAVKVVYWRARNTVELDYSEVDRCKLRQGFESELMALAQPYLNSKKAPQRVLAKRIDNFLGELFSFVQWPEIPSENNAAERAIRPAVIARKVSGGTRSEKGSKTSATLRSLFGTWTLNHCDALEACRQMIVQANHQPTHR